MHDEGVIKFHSDWTLSDPLPHHALSELMKWRDKLFAAGLIGQDHNGVGYGNISIRYGSSFIISGTQTGGAEMLDERGYCQVTYADIENNRLACRGPVNASSESLTHAVFYRLNNAIQCVFHIHNEELWNALYGKIPTSRSDVPYGTPKMAGEIERLWHDEQLQSSNILVMGGHAEGIITFGSSFKSAAIPLERNGAL